METVQIQLPLALVQQIQQEIPSDETLSQIIAEAIHLDRSLTMCNGEQSSSPEETAARVAKLDAECQLIERQLLPSY